MSFSFPNSTDLSVEKALTNKVITISSGLRSQCHIMARGSGSDAFDLVVEPGFVSAEQHFVVHKADVAENRGVVLESKKFPNYYLTVMWGHAYLSIRQFKSLPASDKQCVFKIEPIQPSSSEHKNLCAIRSLDDNFGYLSTQNLASSRSYNRAGLCNWIGTIVSDANGSGSQGSGGQGSGGQGSGGQGSGGQGGQGSGGQGSGGQGGQGSGGQGSGGQGSGSQGSGGHSTDSYQRVGCYHNYQMFPQVYSFQVIIGIHNTTCRDAVKPSDVEKIKTKLTSGSESTVQHSDEWEKSSSDTWSEAKQIAIPFFVGSDKSVSLYQLQGKCGDLLCCSNVFQIKDSKTNKVIDSFRFVDGRRC